MALAMMKSHPQLRLHLRCENCLRESSKLLEVPAEVDLPDDAQDLAAEGYLDNVQFYCVNCDSSIGKLFAISGGKGYE